MEKRKRKTKRKNKTLQIALILGITLFIVLVFSTIFALINMNNSNIVSGVKIENINMSGLTQEEAKTKLELIYKEKKEKDIVLQYEEYETNINSELLDTNYKIEEAVKQAISIGKEKNIFENNYDILAALLGIKNINVEMEINDEETRKTIEDIGTKLPGAVTEPEYIIENDNLIISKGKEGITIDEEQLLKQIKEKLQNITDNENYIEIPILNKKPEEINIEKIYEEVHKEAKDAYYTKDPFVLYPEVIGIDFDIEEAKQILQEDK